MNDLVRILRSTGIIERLREQLSPEEQIEFDKKVLEEMKDLNKIYQEMQGVVAEYINKVKPNESRQDQHGQRDGSDET